MWIFPPHIHTNCMNEKSAHQGLLDILKTFSFTLVSPVQNPYNFYNNSIKYCRQSASSLAHNRITAVQFRLNKQKGLPHYEPPKTCKPQNPQTL